MVYDYLAFLLKTVLITKSVAIIRTIAIGKEMYHSVMNPAIK